jgi:hypothetical protein
MRSSKKPAPAEAFIEALDGISQPDETSRRSGGDWYVKKWERRSAGADEQNRIASCSVKEGMGMDLWGGRIERSGPGGVCGSGVGARNPETPRVGGAAGCDDAGNPAVGFSLFCCGLWIAIRMSVEALDLQALAAKMPRRRDGERRCDRCGARAAGTYEARGCGSGARAMGCAG